MKTTLLLLSMTIFLFTAAYAQDDPLPEGKGRERLEQLRRIKMIDALDLNEEQALRLSVREKEFREGERALLEKRKGIIKGLHGLIEEKADDSALRNQLVHLDEIDAQIAHEKHTFLLSLNDFLSMQQIAKIVLFEQHFRQEVRRLLENAGRPPRR
ncbi:MAG: hypothetical protein IH600_13520 [Bacteroidetes bacterium]|nr:hypothetical protein [Bacteroidota bacterium]